MQKTRCCSEFTSRFPAQPRKKYAWSTQGRKYTGPLGPVVVTGDGGKTRIARHVLRDREQFYRFSTKPNWQGLKSAYAGAASVMSRH